MSRSAWEERLKGMKRTPEPKPQGGDGKRQVVHKVTSHLKTKAGVKKAADYISSNGGKKDKVAYDQDGRELKDEQIHEYIEEWDLLTNSENLSSKAKAASAAERANMSYKERFRHVQAVSTMLSVPVEHNQVSDETLHKIAQEFLEPLNMEGHRALYSIHRHQKRPHIHFLIESQGDKGRLRITKAQLQSLREWGAEVSRRNGIKSYAHKREDRENVIKRVQEGKEALRPESDAWKKVQIYKNQQTGRPLLERQAPSWYERHGVFYEARRCNEIAAEAIAPQPVKLPALSASANKELNDRFAKMYESSTEARASFLEMVAENRKTAFWYVNNRPEIFGAMKDPEKKAYLAHRHLKISEKWRTEARTRIQEHLVDRPHGEFEKNRTLADLYRDRAEAERQKTVGSFEIQRLDKLLGEGWKQDIVVEVPKPKVEPERDTSTKGFSIMGVYERLVKRAKIDKEFQPEHNHINMRSEEKSADQPKPETRSDRVEGAKAKDLNIEKATKELYEQLDQGRDAQKGRKANTKNSTPSRTRGRTREK